MNNIDLIDHFRDQAIALDPYEYYGHLVSTNPVYVEPNYGVAIVTGLEEAQTVLRDSATYSSSTVVAGPAPDFIPVPIEGDDITDLVSQYRDRLPQSDQIVTFDPPQHTAHRGLLMGLIVPKRLKENEDFIWRLTDRQLDAVLSQGHCELINDYAQPYTLLVIADLLGVPEADHPMLLERTGLSDNQLGSIEAEPAAGQHSLAPLYDYFVERIEERRREPTGDVLSGLANSTFPDGSVPAPVEVARIASNLFAAGQETTVRLLGAVLQVLGDDLELQQRLRDDRTLIPTFIEEVLRTQGPIKGAFRFVQRSTTLAGVDLPAGTTVFVSHGAADRDPRKFECPNEFRAERANVRRHIAFGFGAHTCPGAPLARSEVRITLERLFDRTTQIRISEAAHGPAGARRYQYMPTFMFRGLVSLNLEFARGE
jgi:cytochrome P450